MFKVKVPRKLIGTVVFYVGKDVETEPEARFEYGEG